MRNCELLFNARLHFIQTAFSVLYSENFEHVLTAVGLEHISLVTEGKKCAVSPFIRMSPVNGI